jgi:hypothetical protein
VTAESATTRPEVALAAFGLPGAQIRMPSAPLEHDAWERLVGKVGGQRLEGLFARAVADGALPATGQQRDQAYEIEIAAAVRSLRIERALLAAWRALADQAIDVRVLKGSAVAHLDYPDPAIRGFGDVDLLVSGRQLEAAIGLLLATGAERPLPELHPGFDRRFGKGVMLKGSDGIELDVHRSLLAGPYGLTVDLDHLLASSEPYALGGEQVLALGRVERFLHACYHAALGDPATRLVPLRDVIQMALHPDLDWPRVLDLAGAWRGEPVLARAIRLAWDRFALDHETEASAWAGGFIPSIAQQRALDSYLVVDRRFGRQALAALRVIPGVGAKAAYVRALAMPSRQHLRARKENPIKRLAHGTRLIREGRRPGGPGPSQRGANHGRRA